MSQLPPLLKPILPPLLKPAPTLEELLGDPWELTKLGKDALEIKLYDTDLNCVSKIIDRLEAFRLIGQLERIAASL